jgi:hypothetical protein
VIAETTPHCGQTGYVCRVFWREQAPWVLLRSRRGLLLSVPWAATDLPVPPTPGPCVLQEEPAVLLTPEALIALVRFLHHRAVRPTPGVHP